MVRTAVVSVVAAVLLSVAPTPAGVPTSPQGPRLNFVILLTDDQSIDTLPHDPTPMPYLQAALQDPLDHWIQFTNAFLNASMCCPSRASILTGQYSHHTHVE